MHIANYTTGTRGLAHASFPLYLGSWIHSLLMEPAHDARRTTCKPVPAIWCIAHHAEAIAVCHGSDYSVPASVAARSKTRRNVSDNILQAYFKQ